MKKYKLTVSQKRRIAKRFVKFSGLSTVSVRGEKKEYPLPWSWLNEENNDNTVVISIEKELEVAVIYGITYMEAYFSDKLKEEK